MKEHSTNYFNTLIEVAPDTGADKGSRPPEKNTRTIAAMQYDLIAGHPYKYTSDDVVFLVYAERNDLPANAMEESRKQFFSKGQPCLRTSPLTKTYGFGIHSDDLGRVALLGMETDQYERFQNDETIRKVKAMKSKK